MSLSKEIRECASSSYPTSHRMEDWADRVEELEAQIAAHELRIEMMQEESKQMEMFDD